ncbi:MAG: hypothetical protein P8Q89_01220, partial [Alphaproteobacteria bacterium]|nr:hypothetical protein [Alphaproteobacteria bacterium]
PGEPAPALTDGTTPRLWLGTQRDAAGAFSWTPRVTAIAIPPSTERTQIVNLISDYGKIERRVYDYDATDKPEGLQNPYPTDADFAGFDLFNDGNPAMVDFVVTSIKVNQDFNFVYGNEDLALPTEIRDVLRGDGGADHVVLTSGKGNVILGEGDDTLRAEDTADAKAFDPDADQGPATGESGLAVMGDAGTLSRYLGMTDGALTGDRLIMAQSSGDTAQVFYLDEADNAIKSTEQTQLLRGGDDDIDLGAGHHMVFGGVGADVIRLAADAGVTADYLRQIVAGDNAVAWFDPRLGVPPRTVLYFATSESEHGSGIDPATGLATGTGSLLANQNPFSKQADPISTNDTITIGSGDLLVYGGLGADTITMGTGRHIIGGDQTEIRTSQYDAALDDNLLLMTSKFPAINGGNDIITSGGEQVIAILGGGDDTATVQDRVTDPAEGRAIVIGGRGDMRFVHQMANPGPLAPGDTREMPELFETERLLDIRSSDSGMTGQSAGGDDTITLGAGRRVVIGGGGDDTITGGDGRSIVAGDNADLVLKPSEDDFILSTFWSEGNEFNAT